MPLLQVREYPEDIYKNSQAIVQDTILLIVIYCDPQSIVVELFRR